MKKGDYIPAFHFHWLAHWYDPAMRFLFSEEKLKLALISQAAIQSDQNVLDIGCGTGTLTLLIKQVHPDVFVYGLDVDPMILDIAQLKIRQVKQVIALQQGTAASLPYNDESFDHIFISLTLHHLMTQDKRQTIMEAFRVLKPGGKMHILDFGKPCDSIMWLLSLGVRWFEEIHDNVLGLLPVFMNDAGFNPVEEVACHRTILGSIVLYRAYKPIAKDDT